MALGRVSSTGSGAPPLARPAGKGDDNDVPREPRSTDHAHDRAALIGDHRRRHHPERPQGLRPLGEQLLHPPGVLGRDLPLRPHHGPQRDNFNANFNFSPGGIPATLGLLFTFGALAGQLGDFDTLPENWIIEWERMTDAGQPFDKTRKMDTRLVEFLFDLRDVQSTSEAGDGARLAVRNLLRGYLLRMPTGQADQVQALQDGGFLERTPLWFYIHFPGQVLLLPAA